MKGEKKRVEAWKMRERNKIVNDGKGKGERIREIEEEKDGE